MKAEWLVAKYVPDLRRREPRNVGVVLFAGPETLMRFRGQRPDGTVDGRSARVRETDVYKGWIDYWQHLARSFAERQEWPRHHSFDSYWLERGGELLSEEDLEPSDLLVQLYETLVEETPDPDWKLADRVRDLLRQAELLESEHLLKGYSIPAPQTGETYKYPYAYVNGHRAIADQMVQVGARQARTRLWEFGHLPEDVRKIVFVEQVPDDPSVGLLRQMADVLEVGRVSPTHVREVFLTPAPVRRLKLSGWPT